MRVSSPSARTLCALHLFGISILLVPVATAQQRVPSNGNKLSGDWMYPVLTYEMSGSPIVRRGSEVDPRARRQPTDLQRKLGIIIPKIEFKSTSLSDAVEFLRQEAVRCDPKADPVRLDVRIECGTPTANPRFTLTMVNMPLREALRYAAEQAGMTLRIEADGVAMVPASGGK